MVLSVLLGRGCGHLGHRWRTWKRHQRSTVRYAIVPVGTRITAGGLQRVYGVISFDLPGCL